MANICRSKNISSLHDALCSIFNLISFDACSYLAYRSSPNLPNCPLANRNIMTKINFTMKKYGNVIIAVGVPPRLEGRESEVIITGVETPFIFFLLCFDIQWKYSYWNEERIIFIHSQEMNKSSVAFDVLADISSHNCLSFGLCLCVPVYLGPIFIVVFVFETFKWPFLRPWVAYKPPRRAIDLNFTTSNRD